MTISDMIDKVNDIYNDIDDLTQIPCDIRGQISTMLEEIVDKLDSASDEYGDAPTDSPDDEDDDNY